MMCYVTMQVDTSYRSQDVIMMYNENDIIKYRWITIIWVIKTMTKNKNPIINFSQLFEQALQLTYLNYLLRNLFRNGFICNCLFRIVLLRCISSYSWICTYVGIIYWRFNINTATNLCIVIFHLYISNSLTIKLPWLNQR